jgi:hypothetical protein
VDNSSILSAGAPRVVPAIAGLAELWAETLGDPRIVIAVLDGPVDRSHSCFAGARLTTLPTLVSESAGAGRMSAHGTHIASLIFGQPGSPVQGIAPGCRGVIAPIFSDDRPGPASQLDLARAINQAVEAGAHVINISGGEPSQDGQADPLLASAVRFCNDEGVLIVAAAGNDACRCLHVPAALPSVLAVGATDSRGVPLDSSNWGDAYRTQGILAPGEKLAGAAPGGGIALRSGTSFATPIVTGLVGLLLSLQLKSGETPDPHAIRQALLASAFPCDADVIADCQRFLAGRLNLPGACALISPRRRNAMSNESPVHDPLLANGANHGTLVLSGGVTAQEAPEKSPAENGQLAAAAESAPPASRLPAETPGVKAAAAIPESPVAVPPGRSDSAGGGRIGAAHSPVAAASVTASECACNGYKSNDYVFAIGVLGYDFGTEAKRDGFKAQMPSVTPDTGIPFLGGDEKVHPYPANPYDPRQIVNYLAGYPAPVPPYPTAGGYPRLEGDSAFPDPIPNPPRGYPGFAANPADAAELIWTLNIELTPIYAIRPSGTFAAETYQRLVAFLSEQIRSQDDPGYVSRVSIPGVLTGETVQLFSGQVIPVVCPNLRLMYAWTETQLVELSVAAALQHALDNAKKDPAQEGNLTPEKEGKPRTLKPEAEAGVRTTIRTILDRFYYDLRNLGHTAAERAMNFAATNAFQFATIAISDSVIHGRQLDQITVERSSFCRKDSDCWDVKLRFFDPINILVSRAVFRFTVDVSDVNPVLVGKMRHWNEAP